MNYHIKHVGCLRLFDLALAMALAALLYGCGGSSSSSSSDQAKQQTVGAEETNVADSVSSMQVGDLYYIAFDPNGDADVSFSEAGADTKYTLVVQSTETSASSLAITSTNISTDFDSMLRDHEAVLPETEIVANPPPRLSKSLSKAVGDSGTFRVLSSITSVTSYTTVTATSKCVKNHVITYVDNAVTSANLTDSDIETLCVQFELAASIDEGAFGAPSDVNGDGHVVILITPAVNRLGASGGGIVTGYFYASDLFSRSSSNTVSNEMEIIYILAPDPTGTYGTAISHDFAMSNLMPAVVPHELQHAISYNQHVMKNEGSSEENWLNEAISHFAEDLTGFGMENPSRVEVYLSDPENTSLAPTSSPDLSERGAGYLFLRYMYEQAGGQIAFLSALENTTETGTQNIVKAFAGTDANFDEWTEFMRRWGVALALTNTGLSSAAQYQFDDRTLNSLTSNWQGICLICDADDGRGTVLTGPATTELTSGTANLYLSGTATAFYTITSPPSTVTLRGNSGSGLQGVLIRTE